MDFCILFPSFESERFDMYCTVAAAQKLLRVVVQGSNQRERERDSAVSDTCHLFWQILNYIDCCIALSAGD